VTKQADYRIAVRRRAPEAPQRCVPVWGGQAGESASLVSEHQFPRDVIPLAVPYYLPLIPAAERPHHGSGAV